MADASIPVNLSNPGQVFASLGFLEAADVLLGDAEGGFDWSSESNVRFVLRAAGETNPFAVVLGFLADADVTPYAPLGYIEIKKQAKAAADEESEELSSASPLRLSESFPNRAGDRMALPIRLESNGRPSIEIGHWADGSHRNEFKLYAGNRSAESIARAMLHGTREKPRKKQSVGAVKTLGVAALWGQQSDALKVDPYGVLTPVGGSFNFDPRGGWTALDAGYSPNEHGDHTLAASPVVETLAALGLENARPVEYERRRIRYGAWSGLLPPILARPALAAGAVALTRTFRFTLELSGKNKIVTFAEEEKVA